MRKSGSVGATRPGRTRRIACAPRSADMPDIVRLDREALQAWPLPVPDGEGDKEVRGAVLVVAGSAEIPGAAILAANAALRAGAGKLVIATVASVAVHVAVAVPESRVIGLVRSEDGGLTPDSASALREAVDDADAVLVGPGFDEGPQTLALVRKLVAWCAAASDRPSLVLDAAAMAAVHDAPSGARLLVTPHAGEMAKLTGAAKSEVLGAAGAMAADAAQRWQAVVALKGASTFVASPDGRMWCHVNPNPGLAMSGSGDTLAGAIAGLAARGATLEQAAAWGVVLHADAGERLARRGSGLGFLARELPAQIADLLPHVGDGNG